MKKILLIALCYWLPYTALACGCDMFITYQGIMPSDYNKTFGVSMRQRFYKGDLATHLHSDGAMHSHGTSTQVLTNYELNYKIFIRKRISIAGNVPVADYIISSGKVNTRNIGISDPYFLAKYELITPSKDDEKIWKHRLLVGAGVKLPFGKSYSDFKNDIPFDESLLQLQLGTGSVDALSSLNYQLKYKKTGIQADVNYKYNTANKYDFIKGNQVNVQTNLFYLVEGQKSIFMPFAGATMEQSQKDQIGSNKLINTGGTNWFANVGAEYYLRQVSFYFTYQHLLNNHLGGVQMKNNLRFAFGANFIINKQ